MPTLTRLDRLPSQLALPGQPLGSDAGRLELKLLLETALEILAVTQTVELEQLPAGVDSRPEVGAKVATAGEEREALREHGREPVEKAVVDEPPEVREELEGVARAAGRKKNVVEGGMPIDEPVAVARFAVPARTKRNAVR